MLKRYDLPTCPVGTSLMLMGDRWKIQIIWELLTGTKRFGEIRKALDISQKVLTEHLRIMEESGLVHREVFAKVPPHVEYSLTELGKSLRPIFDAMWTWGEEYQAKMKQLCKGKCHECEHAEGEEYQAKIKQL